MNLSVFKFVVCHECCLSANIHFFSDGDIADLYGVETKRINEQVKRNANRFPEEFLIRLNRIEFEELVANCDRFGMLKHSSSLPYAFMEQGVAMLSSVLRSNRAIQVNIAIMDAFVGMRKHFTVNGLLNERFDFLERKQVALEQGTSRRFQLVFDALDEIKINPNLIKHHLILNGQKLEADVAYTLIYGLAERSIFVIDHYVGFMTAILCWIMELKKRKYFIAELRQRMQEARLRPSPS